MTTYKIDDCGKGVNKDLLPAELNDGFWSDALNFRFRNGFAEKWEGIASYKSIASFNLHWLQLYGTTATGFVIMASGNTTAGEKVYAYNPESDIATDITRYQGEVAITSITRIAANTAEVTTAAVHGLATNDVVTHFGATESGYNETQAAVTVMSTTVYRYTTTNAIASNATVVGSYVVHTSAATQDFSKLERGDKWTGGVFQGTLIANHQANGLFYWAGDTTLNLRKVGFLSYVADVARPFKNYIIQLAPTMAGTKYQRRVLWSNAAEPGAMPTSFTAADTNDAGLVDLAESDGAMVDCLPYGDVNIVYTEDARYAMQYIGGDDVFRFAKLPGADGLFARSCVVNTPVGHVFLTNDLDVKVHSGGEARSIADGRIKDYIKSVTSAYPAYKAQAFLAVHPAKTEVWVCTSSDGNACDKLFVWNWTSDTWSRFDVSSAKLTCGTNGLFPRRVSNNAADTLLVGSGTQFGTSTFTSGGTYFGATITGTLERTGMHMGDRDTFKSVQRSRWNIDGTATNTASVYHGSSKTADGTVTYTSAATYTIGTTDYVNARATAGRFGAIKLTTTAYPLSVRSIDLDVTGGGKR